MDHGHKDLREVQLLISELPKTKEFTENPDFKSLYLSLKNEETQKYTPAAINSMSKNISMYLMTHNYSAPKELIDLQKILVKLNTKQNSLRHIPFLFNLY
ncbi:bacteriocin immunity protein [Ligilactobacillus faecis]|uniref:Bacteriocin immunity protein n=1 Tax=Ligilactobacillus faecis TaxID=762833 RepID=A0ABV4DRZ6_9LACO